MQNTISVFSFKSQNVRTQILGAEPWFCLGDVAEILQIQNARQLPLKDQGIQKSSVATKKGNQELLFINEPNLYRVIFRSRKAEAVKFQDWIFEEVIPQIRKTGGYQITPKTTADDRTGLRRAVAALVGRKRIGYSSAYSMIHQRFNVESVEGIPAGKLPEAVAYVHALTLHTGLAGEV
ncbi:TPA: Bro-N domain-containing protein, partial [Neisseria gonorrhoeae]